MPPKKLRVAEEREEDPVIMASYKVAYDLTQGGHPFTDGGAIKRGVMAVVGELCPEKMDEFEKCNFEPDTIRLRIKAIGDNILEQIAEKARHFEQYSIALDELDAFDAVQLLIFFRGIDSDFNVTQGLATMQRMQGPVTGETLFQYLEMTLSNYHLEWKKLKCVTIGGNNISGAKEALMEQVAQAAASGGFPKPKFLHCVIHQLALGGKQVDILSVLKPVMSMVNYIRDHGCNHRPFHEFMKETDSVFADLSTKMSAAFDTFAESPAFADDVMVQWLNFGEVLSQFFQLREEIKSFLPEDVQQKQLLSKTDWLWKLAFVVDLMGHMNEVCLRLRRETNLFTDVQQQVMIFRKKLLVLEELLQSRDLTLLPCAAKFHEESQEPTEPARKKTCTALQVAKKGLKFQIPVPVQPTSAPREQQQPPPSAASAPLPLDQPEPLSASSSPPHGQQQPTTSSAPCPLDQPEPPSSSTSGQAEFPFSFAEDIIANLLKQFHELLPDFEGEAEEIEMLRNPFLCDVGIVPPQCQLEIMRLRSNVNLKKQYREKDLLEFYKSLPSEEFPELKQLACGYLSIFGTSLFGETLSKKYLHAENRANLSEALLKFMLIIGSSNLEPQFHEIFQQHHP